MVNKDVYIKQWTEYTASFFTTWHNNNVNGGDGGEDEIMGTGWIFFWGGSLREQGGDGENHAWSVVAVYFTVSLSVNTSHVLIYKVEYLCVSEWICLLTTNSTPLWSTPHMTHILNQHDPGSVLMYNSLAVTTLRSSLWRKSRLENR